MDFPCVSSGPQCCWTLLGVILFKPLRIYSFHNFLTKLANCRKAPNLDGDWWLGHWKIMFVKNSPKPACTSHTSPTCALVHGKSSKTQPCCKTSGESSRKRSAWMTSESTRNAERTCLEVLSKQNKVDLPQYKRSFPWTETGRLDSKTSYSLFQKMVSSFFINLPSFVRNESLTTSWDLQTCPVKLGSQFPCAPRELLLPKSYREVKAALLRCVVDVVYVLYTVCIYVHICICMYMYMFVNIIHMYIYIWLYMDVFTIKSK